MATVGYIRVSTVIQNTDRQLHGMALDKVFTDKISGKSTDRPELTRCLEYLREGDKLVVHSLDRFARSLTDAERVILGLLDRGVAFQSVKEGLNFDGKLDPFQKVQLQMFGMMAEFERNLINQRASEGRAIAMAQDKQAGRKSRFGVKPVATHAQREKVRQWLAQGESERCNKSQLMKDVGLSRGTLYRVIEAESQTV